MTVTVEIIDRIEKQKEYPYIGKTRRRGGFLYVLFTKENTGIVIRDDLFDVGSYTLGQYYTSWTESMFEEFNGSITLTA